jgi:hypothetical protein
MVQSQSILRPQTAVDPCRVLYSPENTKPGPSIHGSLVSCSVQHSFDLMVRRTALQSLESKAGLSLMHVFLAGCLWCRDHARDVRVRQGQRTAVLHVVRCSTGWGSSYCVCPSHLVVGVVGVKLVSPVVASSLVHFLRRPIPAVGGDWHKWREVRLQETDNNNTSQ